MSKKNTSKKLKVKRRSSARVREKQEKEHQKEFNFICKKLQKKGMLPLANPRWEHTKSTLILLMILVWSCCSFFSICNLDYFVNEQMAPQHRTFMLLMFAVVMETASVIIWDDMLEKIDKDYPFLHFASIVFFLCIVCGAATYVFFMVLAVGQWYWWSPDYYYALSAPIFGTLLFISFIYKVEKSIF